jgi:urease accessory protein
VDQLAHLRLLQLLSPVLPVGSFSYSQGLEWAVQDKWISDEKDFLHWLLEWIDGSLAQQDLPLLIRLYNAANEAENEELDQWSQLVLATRDTKELREEELNRANAYLRVLKGLSMTNENLPIQAFRNSPLASIAWAAAQWSIPLDSLLLSYSHNWLENAVTNGVKLIPLGQTAGQRLIHDISPQILIAVENSKLVGDHEIGFSMPAISMASSAHETQYSRMYRS